MLGSISMQKRLLSFWNGLVNWFERGDLVPLIVIVSALHYSQILKAHDHVIVATAIGMMVDLGHYRTVRSAVRYSGSSIRTRNIRWLMTFFFTAVSIVYQQRFYNDWWFSLPLPLLIVALAWLQQTDKIGVQRRAIAEEKPEQSEQSQSKPKAKTYIATCEVCDWSKNGYKSKRAATNGKNAHMRTHTK